MTNYSRTTLRELKKRYLNILKKCLLANLMAFSFALPSMAEETWNEIELTTQIKTQADVDALNLGSGNTKINYSGTGDPIWIQNEDTLISTNNKSLTFHTNNRALVAALEKQLSFKNINDLTLIKTAINPTTGGSIYMDISGNFIMKDIEGDALRISAYTNNYFHASSIDISSSYNPILGRGTTFIQVDDTIRLKNIGSAGAAIFVEGGNTYIDGKHAVLIAPDLPLQGYGHLILGGHIDKNTGEKKIAPFKTVIVENGRKIAADGALSRQQAIYMYGEGVLEIYSEFIELNAYDKDPSIVAVGAAPGSKVFLESEKKLVINGGVGIEGGKGTVISLKTNGGDILVTGNIDALNPSTGELEEQIIITSTNGNVEIKGHINQENLFKNNKNLIKSGEYGVFILLDKSTFQLYQNTNIQKITSFDSQIDLTKTTKDTIVQIDELEGEGTTILTDSTEVAKTTIGSNKSKKLTVAATSKLNDEVNNPEMLANSLAKIVNIQEGEKDLTLAAEEGRIQGQMTAELKDGSVKNLQVKANTVTESVKDVMGLQVLSFRNQINDVQKRMGDLRLDENLKGTWVRTFGGDVKFGDMGLKNKYNTLQAGADFKKGNAYFGIMASLTEGESDMDRGTGEDKTYGMGVYAGYMTNNGWYVDATAKQMHLQNKFKARYNTGELSRGSYKTWGTSVSLEAGKRMNLPCGFFVEPQAEVMYGRVQGINYTTSAGVKVEQEAFESLIGRAGLSVGKTFKDKGSVYANVSVLNDFAGKVKTTFSYWNQETKTRDDMGGAWTEFAVGGTYKLNKNTAVYGEFATSKGTDLTNPVQWSLGLRFSF